MPTRKHYMTHSTPLDDPLRWMQLLQAAESVHNTNLNAISIHRFKCVSREWRGGLSSFHLGLNHSTYVENYLLIF
ncbi:hypothetical protein Hanom_Chr01g00054731 [Helianthus anomalus]